MAAPRLVLGLEDKQLLYLKDFNDAKLLKVYQRQRDCRPWLKSALSRTVLPKFASLTGQDLWKHGTYEGMPRKGAVLGATNWWNSLTLQSTPIPDLGFIFDPGRQPVHYDHTQGNLSVDEQERVSHVPTHAQIVIIRSGLNSSCQRPTHLNPSSEHFAL